MKKKKTDSNYLDFVPIHCKDFQSQKEEENPDKTELVTILVENKGFFNRLAQKLLKKPPISYIHLDAMGSFLWLHIDGNSTIYEIAQFVKEQFGEKAEPLYPRLLQYIRTLEDYGFIKVKKP